MIKIHHARRTRSARVIWLLEEIGVPYEIVPLEFTPENLKSAEYKKLHPLGQAPVIEEDGALLFESGAIVEYLLEKFGQGRLAPAPGSKERAEYFQWFHFGEASLARHVTEIVRNRFGKPEEARLPEVVAESRLRLREALDVVERVLDGRRYILGEPFTAADIMIAYGIVMAKIIGDLPTDLPNIQGYLSRLKERPSYERAWS